MDQSEVLEGVVKIITPYVKSESSLKNIGMQTDILNDLQVNSARLVDIVLAFEDAFGIEIADEDADSINTIGDAVKLILRKQG